MRHGSGGVDQLGPGRRDGVTGNADLPWAAGRAGRSGVTLSHGPGGRRESTGRKGGGSAEGSLGDRCSEHCCCGVFEVMREWSGSGEEGTMDGWLTSSIYGPGLSGAKGELGCRSPDGVVPGAARSPGSAVFGESIRGYTRLAGRIAGDVMYRTSKGLGVIRQGTSGAAHPELPTPQASKAGEALLGVDVIVTKA